MFWPHEDEEEEPSRPLNSLIGPVWLAGNIGLTTGVALTAAELLLFSAPCGLLQWLQALLLGGGCGAAGAIIGSLTARDELLRTNWAKCRWLVGLLSGGLVGAVAALLLGSGLLLLGGTIGGALGGFLDTLIHGDILEEDW